MFKVYKNLSSTIVAEIFCARNNYNLRYSLLFSIPYVKTVYHGSESLSNLGPKIWNLVPSTLKKLDDVKSFKTQIKKWEPENCPYRLCKTYIPQIHIVFLTILFNLIILCYTIIYSS